MAAPLLTTLTQVIRPALKPLDVTVNTNLPSYLYTLNIPPPRGDALTATTLAEVVCLPRIRALNVEFDLELTGSDVLSLLPFRVLTRSAESFQCMPLSLPGELLLGNNML